ncbi:hypothetical protein D3C87_80430 [compost metagenome]
MIGFDRKGFGKYQKYDSIYSVFHATDAFLLEDELNEAQWERIEQIASHIRSQLKSGFVDKFTINAANYTNFFAIEGTNGTNPISLLVNGYQLKVGANQILGQPSGLVSADNRLIVQLTPVGAATRTDLVLLETWFEVIDKDEVIHKLGGVDTPALNNEILDDRMDIETSRRIQFRWRLRTIDGTSSMTGVKALKYDGADSGVVYSSLDNIYIANVGEYHLPNGSLKATGAIYALPLFTVTRSATNIVTNANITDISAKAIPADGFAKDFMTSAANIVESANKRFVSDAEKATWNAAEANAKAYADSKINRVDLTQNITYGNNLITSDDNGSELESAFYGRTSVNILGDIGSGESLTGWTLAGGTVPTISTTQKRSGISSFKIASGATGGSYLLRDFTAPLDNTKQYLLCCWVFVESWASAAVGPSFTLYDVGTNNQRYQTANIAAVVGSWQLLTLKIPTGNSLVGAGFRLLLGNGSIGTSVSYYDEVRLYEVTSAEYTAIGTTITGSAIDEYFPYVSSKKHINGISVTRPGVNLLSGILDTLNANAKMNGPYEMTLTATAAFQNSYMYAPAVSNTTYTLSVKDNLVANQQLVVDCLDSTGTKISTSFVLVSPNRSLTFTTWTGTTQLRIIPTSAIAGTYTFRNWQLEFGSAATGFVSSKPQRAILPFTLGEVNGVKDKVYSQGANWLYQENVKKDVSISGENTNSVVLNSTGYRTIIIKAIQDMSIGDFSYRMIKYDNKLLTNINSDSSSSITGADQTIQIGTDKTLRISVKNSDVGWTDAIVPTDNAVRAAFNGWKAISNDGTYYTWWTSIVDDVAPATNTDAFVSSNKAPGWTGWVTMDYTLEKPSMPIVINNAEGAISLHPGKNIINVESGVVQREKVTLVYNSAGGVYELNRPDGIYTTSKTSKRIGRILDIYEGADILPVSNYSVIPFGSSNTDNGVRVSIPTANVNASKDHYVSYVVMDKYAVSTSVLEGTAQFKTGLSGVVSDTVQSVADIKSENDRQDFADDYIEAKVDNVRVDFDNHNSDSTRHITATERTTWNAKETTTGSQTKATDALNSAKIYTDTQLLLKSDKATTYTKTETDAKIQSVIGAAPAALDTLKEIGDALNNDPNFAATITTQLSNKVDKITGKQLSTEDFTSSEKAKLASLSSGIGGDNTVSDNAIGDRTFVDTVVPTSSTGKLTAILGWFANRIKAITGKSGWLTDPAINLEQTKAHVDNTTVHITSSERTTWNAAEANAKAASIPLTQKNGAGGVAALDANANVLAVGAKFSSYSKRAFLLGFTGVANQKIDLYWTESPHGMFKINIGGAYAGNDAIGGITKEFNVVLSPPSTVNGGAGFYTKADGKLPNYISISDISYDATNSRYKISIEHRASVINSYSMTVESWASVRDVNFNISAVYVGSVTALPVAVQTIADNTVTQSGYEIQKHALTGNTGLGKGGVLTVNANTLTSTGYYTLNLASTNIPVAGNTTTIQVEQLDSSYISQEANVYSTINTATMIRKFSRESRNGGTSWSAWREYSMKALPLANSTDLNTLVNEGQFYAVSNASAATITNQPAGFSAGYCFNLDVKTTVSADGTGCNQTLTYYSVASTSISIYTRNFYQTTWTAWQQIETAAAKNAANGYAGLDANGDVLDAQLPDTLQKFKLTESDGTGKTLASGDLDTVKTTGIYALNGGTYTNSPFGGSASISGKLEVLKINSTAYMQTMQVTPTLYVWSRRFDGTSWNAWVEIENTNRKNIANGYAGLDANSRVLDSNKLEGKSLSQFSAVKGSSVADLNLLTETGIYHMGNITNYTNATGLDSWCVINVYTTSLNYVVQEATSVSTYNKFFRTRTELNVWNSWKKIASDGDSPDFKSVKISSKIELQYNTTENSLDIVFL